MSTAAYIALGIFLGWSSLAGLFLLACIALNKQRSHYGRCVVKQLSLPIDAPRGAHMPRSAPPTRHRFTR